MKIPSPRPSAVARAVPAAGVFPTLCVVLASILAPHAVVGQEDDLAETHRVACERGDLPSCTLVGLILETGADGFVDRGRALDLYRRACRADIPAGCERLDLLGAEMSGGPPIARAGPDTLRVGDGGPIPGSPTWDPFHRRGRIADAETGEPIPGALVEIRRRDVRVLSDEGGRVDLGTLTRGEIVVVVHTGTHGTLEADLPVPWDFEFLILMERTATSVAEDPETGRLFGRVIEAGGGGGSVTDVEVTLVGEDERVTLTGSDGRFGLADLEPGRAELRFERLGYLPRTATVTVEAGRTIEIHVAMATRPIELAPIEVTVGSAYLERSGFYRRARSTWGTRFTRRDIVGANTVNLTELIQRAPGVQIYRDRMGARVVTRRRAERLCRLRPYVDGAPIPDMDPDEVQPEDVEAIEIYQGAAAPVEYRNLVDPDGTSPCGVVLIWTRRPG